MDKTINPNILKVLIITPQKKLFDGECTSVSSINSTGPFDVLAQHENFISIIRDYIVIKSKSDEQRFEIKEAILKAETNLIHILVGVESIA